MLSSAVGELLVDSTLKLWMPFAFKVVTAKKIDFVPPNYKVAFATRLSPDRGIERHFSAPIHKTPRRAAARIKIDGQLIATSARTCHDQGPRETANDEDGITFAND